MKTSRNLKLLLVLLSLGLAVPFAQAKPKKGSSSTEAAAPALITTADELKAKVNLTDSQYEQAVKIYAAQDAAIKALGSSPELPAVAKIQEDTAMKIDALLTPEQKTLLSASTATSEEPAAKKKKKKSAE